MRPLLPWAPRRWEVQADDSLDPLRPAVPRGGGLRYRSAGVPALDPTGSVPTELPSSADFSQASADVDGAAYWMIGADLFQATAGQVLRDVRGELRVPDSANVWSLGILTRAQAAARARTASVSLPPMPGPADGARLPVLWLKVCLWLAYSDAPVRLDSVRLPMGVTSPTMGGADWGESYQSVRVYRGFDPNLLSVNPFSRVYADPIDVTGDPGGGSGTPPPPAGGGSGSKGNGGLLVGAALALAILGAGK